MTRFQHEDQEKLFKNIYATKLNTFFSWRPMMITINRSRLLKPVTLMCVCHFKCPSGASYVGRTTQQVRQHVAEHHPAGLGNRKPRSDNELYSGSIDERKASGTLTKAHKIISCIPPKIPHGSSQSSQTIFRSLTYVK